MQVTIHDSGDLKAVARALRQHADGKELRKQLTRRLQDELAPLVADVQAAWRSAPGYEGRRSRTRSRRQNLRSLLARATRGEVRLSGRQAGIRVRTDGRRMPTGMKGLPGLAEGLGHAVDRRSGRWRHPVFGDDDTWVSQRPFPRFYRAVQPNEARARQECIRAVEAVFRQIARAR